MVLGLLRRNVFNMSGGAQVQLSPKTLKMNDFTSSNVSISAGKENIVGEFSIDPQTKHRLGFGTPQFQDNQGTIFVNLKDTATTPAELEGEVILSIQDYAGNNNRVVYRGQLSDLRSGESDITKRIKFPMEDIFGLENDKIVMKLIPETGGVGNGTLSAENSKALVASSVEYRGRVGSR